MRRIILIGFFALSGNVAFASGVHSMSGSAATSIEYGEEFGDVDRANLESRVDQNARVQCDSFDPVNSLTRNSGYEFRSTHIPYFGFRMTAFAMYTCASVETEESFSNQDSGSYEQCVHWCWTHSIDDPSHCIQRKCHNK